MVISPETKISALIGFNKRSIDAIASIAKPLEKLKNPILRKVMASRVTIAEAAKMGGCTVEDFAHVLTPLGFEFRQDKDSENVGINMKPIWLSNAKSGDITWFDVRDILSSGSDPLKEILEQFKNVTPGTILAIINSFVPIPLIRLLENKMADSFTEQTGPKVFHTFFYKKHPATDKIKTKSGALMQQVFNDDAATFEKIKNAFPADLIRVIDVRHLEMPLPMQTILGELSSMPTDHILFVHHKRIPVYLLEELTHHSWQVRIWSVDESNVKIIIFNPEMHVIT